MKVTACDISAVAASKELERENDFFKLLYIADKKQAFSSCTISPIEWRMTADCLDQLNYRYADFYGLLALAVCYPMRNRLGRTFFRRNRLPLYLSLVAYDCGLRSTSQSPAITYWNSACVLDSDIGEIARTLNSPSEFYEVAEKDRVSRVPRPLSFLTWMGSSVVFVAESLLLQKVLTFTFEGSHWREKIGENRESSRLSVNSRFFKWDLLEVKLTYDNDRVVYDLGVSMLPTFGFSKTMKRSFTCRRLIMDRSSLGGRLWYGAHFTILTLCGVERH